MIIAKQVPYKNQDSGWDAGNYPGWEFVGGHNCRKHVSEDYEHWMKYANTIINECATGGSSELKSAISYYLNCNVKDENEVRKWKQIVGPKGEYTKCYDSEDTIARALSLIHHKHYIHAIIRGNCQSNWQGVYLPRR